MMCNHDQEPDQNVLRVMLVDDEDLVCRFLEILLESYGCKIHAFNDSTRALDNFRANPDAYDAVISDVLMPRLSGDQLAEEILSIKPGIPVVLISGYSPDLDVIRMKTMGVKYCLTKPIENKRLMQIVDEFRLQFYPDSSV